MRYFILAIVLLCFACNGSQNPHEQEWKSLLKQIDSTKFSHFPYTSGFTPYSESYGVDSQIKKGIFICIAKDMDLIYTATPLKNNIEKYFIVDKGSIEDRKKNIKFISSVDNCSYERPLPNFKLLKDIGFDITNSDILKEGMLISYECGKELIVNKDYAANVGVDVKGWEHGYSLGGLYSKRENVILYWIDAW